MTMLLTPLHKARGSDLRRNVCAIQSMSPWRPAQRLAKSRGKDRSRAPPPWRVSLLEVEIGVSRARPDARQGVGEEGAERRPRFDPRVPILRRLVLDPWHVAQKIGAG